MPAITRPFNYTNRDFTSLIADFRRRMAMAIPEWTGYDSSFEQILLELFAYNGDILNFYIDRMMAEAFLRTASLRESVLDIAQTLGYIPAAQAAAQTTVVFTKVVPLNENVTVPAGTQLFAQVEGLAPVYFETSVDLLIPAANPTGSVVVNEGLTEPLELVGTSVGSERQSFVLHYPNVIRDSIRVFTNTGPVDVNGAATLIQWTYYPQIIAANFYDRAFTAAVDQNYNTYAVFGDRVSGLIPPVNANIYVTYRHGAGAGGNVAIAAIRSFRSASALTTKIASLSNTSAASGGTDPESIDSMRVTIPRSMVALERAVGLQDFTALAIRVPGIAKAAATSSVSTVVNLYLAPVGGNSNGGSPTSPTLLAAVAAYFNGPPTRMTIGTTISYLQPVYVGITVILTVTVNARFRQDAVANEVRIRLNRLYSFDIRSFGELLKKADVFHEVVEVQGVDYVEIATFSRTTGIVDVQLAANEIVGDFTLSNLTINASGGIV